MTLNLRWNSSLTSGTDKPTLSADSKSLLIKGVLVDDSVCQNNWSIDEESLSKLHEQIPKCQLRADHGSSIFNIIGGLTKGEYNPKEKKVYFEGEVDDPRAINLILRGRVDHVSIGAEATAYCSKCQKATKPFKVCKCEGSHDVIKDLKLKEVSLVADPAYGESTFVPVSFVASIENALAVQIQEVKSGQDGFLDDLSVKNQDKTTPVVEDRERREVIKKMEENKDMTTTKIVEASVTKKEDEVKKDEDEAKKEETKLVPAGPDAINVLGKKMEEMFKKQEQSFTKMEEKITKMEKTIEGFGKTTVAPPETHEKKEDEDECKKEDVDEEEDDVKPVKKVKKVKKEEPEEDEEEEEAKPVKKEMKGAKIDTSEDSEKFIGSTDGGQMWNAAWEDVMKAAKRIIYGNS